MPDGPCDGTVGKEKRKEVKKERWKEGKKDGSREGKKSYMTKRREMSKACTNEKRGDERNEASYGGSREGLHEESEERKGGLCEERGGGREGRSKRERERTRAREKRQRTKKIGGTRMIEILRCR
jgi:hypothetical protein